MKKLFLLSLFSLLALFGARAEIANVDDTGDGIANEAVTIDGITYDVTLHGVGETGDGSAQITGVRAADGNEQSLIGLEELVLPETITYNDQLFRVYHRNHPKQADLTWPKKKEIAGDYPCDFL